MTLCLLIDGDTHQVKLTCVILAVSNAAVTANARDFWFIAFLPR